jgi:hypothetical protein
MCRRSTSNAWMTRHFHEKAGTCQVHCFGRVNRKSDCRPSGGTPLASGLSFLERFFVRPSIQPIADRGRRTMLPSRILKSPTRPTSIRTLCGAIAPVPAGCPQLETGAAVSDANSMSLFPASSFLARVAVTRTRRFGFTSLSSCRFLRFLL